MTNNELLNKYNRIFSIIEPYVLNKYRGHIVNDQTRIEIKTDLLKFFDILKTRGVINEIPNFLIEPDQFMFNVEFFLPDYDDIHRE